MTLGKQKGWEGVSAIDKQRENEVSMIDRMLRKDCSKCIIVITQENFPRRELLPILSDFSLL